MYTKSGGSYGAPVALAHPSTDGDMFGDAVAVSGDGTILVVGASYSNITFNGAAYVYTKHNGSYGAPTTLVDPSNMAGAAFGAAVALSADGSTLLVGAPYAGNDHGAAYVSTKSGDGYGIPTPLPSPGATGFDRFGDALAVSGDGGTLLVGAYGTNNGRGAAYVYTKNGGSYGAPVTLAGPDTDDAQYGSAVAVSSDATTLLVGAIGITAHNGGAAYTFIAPIFTPATLPPIGVGAPASVTLHPIIGPGPYTFTVTGGSLPLGFTLDPMTGVLRGTAPTQPGRFTFTVTVTDGTGRARSQSMPLVVAVPDVQPASHQAPSPTGTGQPASQPGRHSDAASGGNAPISHATPATVPPLTPPPAPQPARH